MTEPVDTPAAGHEPPHAKGFGIADISVDRPIFALMMTMALVVVGLMSYGRLGVDLLPEIERPQVTVFTALPGAGAEEIESAVTQPIEEQLNTIAGIEEMRSVNREGFSFVNLTFNLDRPINEAVQDVRDKLSRVVRQLPDGTDPPVISTFDSDSAPILAIAVSGPSSLRELTEFAENRIKDVVATAPGVGAVTIEGGLRRAINIIVDADRLQATGISVLQLRAALLAQNVEIPGGRVTRDAREDILRTMARVETVEQIGEIVVVTREGGAQVLIKDLATVEDGTVEIRGTSRLNGNRAVTLSVQKLAGANIVSTADAIKERLERVRPNLPAGTEMIVLRDASVFVEASVHEARFHLVGGAILAALAVLLFMGSWRSTVIAAVAIPTSVIATFAVMDFMGFTLNNITLLALTLAVGVVIDDAIVVVENIHRHLHHEGMTPKLAAKIATREIALAVSATTLSLVVIFLPVAFMSGQVGRLFYSYGVTVAASIMVSLFVSLTLTPMMSSKFLRSAAESGPKSLLERNADRVMAPLERWYGKAVAWSLDHRALIVGISLVLVAATVPLYMLTPSDFLPEDDQSEFEISIELPTGTSFLAGDDVIQELEVQVAQLPGVKDVLVSVGDAGGTSASSRANIYVGLVPIADRELTQVDVMNRARAFFSRYPDLRVTVRSLNNTGLGGGGRGGKLRLAIRGADIKKLEEILDVVLKEMRAEPLFVDAFSSSADRLPELRMVPDRKKAAVVGVTPEDIAESLRILVGGEIVSSFKDGDERYDVILRAELADRNGADAIGRLPIGTPLGGMLPVDNLGVVNEAVGPNLILRLGGMRQVSLSANPAAGVTLSAAAERLNEIVLKANLPPGYDAVFQGDVQTLDETYREFALALLLSLVFVYMVLAAQFESLLHPITILLAIPLTAPFALLSILLLRESVNIYSIFGVFMLFGIVKKNGILQVDTTNQLVAAGKETRDAIIEANTIRLRPILMTTVTLIAAMAPMTVSSGPGAASRAALAKVIVGGQALSLVITLLIVPVAWSLFDDLRQAIDRRSATKAAKRAEKHAAKSTAATTMQP